MKKTLLLFFMVIFSISLFANEKNSLTYSTFDNEKNNTISFVKYFEKSGLSPLDSSDIEYEKIGNDRDQAAAGGFLAMGIIGTIGSVGCFIVSIVGSSFWGFAYDAFWTEEYTGINYYGLTYSEMVNYYWAGMLMFTISTAALFLIFLPMAICGFLFSGMFARKAGLVSLYIEGRKGVTIASSNSDLNNSTTNAAIGLKYSF